MKSVKDVYLEHDFDGEHDEAEQVGDPDGVDTPQRVRCQTSHDARDYNTHRHHVLPHIYFREDTQKMKGK